MERPPIKDKAVLAYVEYLEGQLKTPYADAFISLKRMVDNGTVQMKNIEFDVFTPEGETKFKQAAKFTSQLKDWYSEMEYFKSKMSPDEIKKVNKEQELSPVERQKVKANVDSSKV